MEQKRQKILVGQGYTTYSRGHGGMQGVMARVVKKNGVVILKGIAILCGCGRLEIEQQNERRFKMLTQEQRKTFAEALTANNIGAETVEEIREEVEAYGYYVEPDDVADTGDTLDAYFDANGTMMKRDGTPSRKLHEIATPVGTVYVWLGLQQRKGLRRGDLYVMDFGDRRAAYFTGETA
jgi:hypothetical protein